MLMSMRKLENTRRLFSFHVLPNDPGRFVSVLMFGYDADYTSHEQEMEKEHVKAADKQVEEIKKKKKTNIKDTLKFYIEEQQLFIFSWSKKIYYFNALFIFYDFILKNKKKKDKTVHCTRPS